MTDRHAGYVVVLAEDIPEDDAAATIAAIKQIKGMLTATPHVASVDILIAEGRSDAAWHKRVADMLHEARRTW